MCLTNIKQIGYYAAYYMNDHKEWVPYAAADIPITGNSANYAYARTAIGGAWYCKLLQYVPSLQPGVNGSDTIKVVDLNGNNVDPRKNFIFNCPSDPMLIATSTVWQGAPLSYSVNRGMARYAPLAGAVAGGNMYQRRLVQDKVPPGRRSLSFCVAISASSTIYAGYLDPDTNADSFRSHDGSMNVLFMDNSARRIAEKEVQVNYNKNWWFWKAGY
jgi:prepilin-type processing-associated H-X9-DG protein